MRRGLSTRANLDVIATGAVRQPLTVLENNALTTVASGAGYMTAGGDLPADKPAKDAPDFPFAGGSGAGVSVQPVGFLVLSGDTVRMLPATCSSVADRVVDLIPTVVEDVKSFLTHQ